MPVRQLPLHPDLDQLKHQARELLRAARSGDPVARAEFESIEERPDPSTATLAEAQLVLARSYGASSWTRLAHGVELANAIWRDDAERVKTLVSANLTLLREPVLIRESS